MGSFHIYVLGSFCLPIHSESSVIASLVELRFVFVRIFSILVVSTNAASLRGRAISLLVVPYPSSGFQRHRIILESDISKEDA